MQLEPPICILTDSILSTLVINNLNIMEFTYIHQVEYLYYTHL